ncbi:MAG: hypothetical protein ACYC27_21885 [Armatimonadota bacterium]
MLVQGLNESTNQVQDIKVTSGGAARVISAGSNEQIFDGQAVWANSAVQNTAVNIDITLPTVLQGSALYMITVTNPSTVTALTVSVKNKSTFGGTAKYPELTRFGVQANAADGRSVLVQGWMLGEGGRLTLSNDTALGGSDGFTAYVRIRKV